MALTPSTSPAALLRDMARLAVSAGLVQGVAVLSLPLLQRWCYGPEAFADFALYSQWAGLLGAIATLRMDLAVVQHAEDRLARAAWQNGLRALAGFILGAAVLAVGLQASGSAMGQVDALWLWLPLGVGAVGLSSLATAMLSRDRHFSAVARFRATGGILGEALRFAGSVMGASGLIAGRIAGQGWTALQATVRARQPWANTPRPTAADRREAWHIDRDYIRFTTPANLLAMAANALLLLFLCASAPKDWVGQIGAALAYLTVAAGLVIRSVSDVFFRHLREVPRPSLAAFYTRWALGLCLASAVGISLLFLCPVEWATALLGERWSGMLPAMRILSLWMPLWIAASALSGIFPHLRKQAWAFGLDVVHLALIAGWLMWNWTGVAAQDLMGQGDVLLMEYAGIQALFYGLALLTGVGLCRRAARSSD